VAILLISLIFTLLGGLGFAWMIISKGHPLIGLTIAISVAAAFGYNLWDILVGRVRYAMRVLQMRDELRGILQGKVEPPPPPPDVRDIIRKAKHKRELEKKIKFDNMFRPDDEV